MKISFNNLKKQYERNSKKLNSAVKRVLSSGYYILGKEVSDFEDKFSKYTNTKYTIGVSNGMAALQICLMALDIGPGDEVITTPHSAVATTLAITSIGATPIFTDIDEFYHLDTKQVEKKITKKTKAIIPVHIYGQPIQIDDLCKISKKYQIPIVEDCAQAHGAKFKNKMVGSFGKFGCFSFYPTKNLGTFGDAGAIVTNDKALADKCRMIGNYGQKNRYEHGVIGLNSRIDEIQAAILSINIENLDSDNSHRREIAQTYANELKDLKNITLPKTRIDATHVHHLFVIEAEKRDQLKDFLNEKGISTLIHYPIPIHKQPCFNNHNKLHFPNIERLASKILSLPINPHITKREVKYICNAIKEFYKSN